MQLSLVIDSATATPDDYKRAVAALAAFGGDVSLTLDRVTLRGPAEFVARAAEGAVADAGAVPPPPPTTDATPDPASIGFGGTPPPPAATTAPPPPPAADSVDATLARVERDADGLPHDSRIHATTKTKNKDGRWKKKPKTDEATVARVEAELRSILGLPAADAAGSTPPPPPAADSVDATLARVERDADGLPPPAATTAAPASITSFAQLMAWVGPTMAAGQLTAAKVEESLRTLGVVDGSGVGQIGLLALRPDLVPGAHEALRAEVA